MNKGLEFIKSHINNEVLMKDFYYAQNTFWESDAFEIIEDAIKDYFIDDKERQEMTVEIHKALSKVTMHIKIVKIEIDGE